MFYPGSAWFPVFLPVFEPPLPIGAVSYHMVFLCSLSHLQLSSVIFNEES